MNYSLNRLTTVAECDNVLASASLELKEFQTEMAKIDLRQGKAGNTVQKNVKALVLNRAELQGLEAAIASVTDPETQEALNARLVKLRNRVEDLEVDTQQKGATSLLKLELDYNQLESNVAVTLDFIAQVQARKASL